MPGFLTTVRFSAIEIEKKASISPILDLKTPSLCALQDGREAQNIESLILSDESRARETVRESVFMTCQFIFYFYFFFSFR